MKKPTIHLVIKSGPEKDRELSVPGRGLRVGRSDQNDVNVDDPQMSRTHCRFFFRSDRLWVTDLGSANATLLNGQPIEREAPLSEKDLVVVGDTQFRVQNAEPSPELPAAARIGRPERAARLHRKIQNEVAGGKAVPAWIAYPAWMLMAFWLLYLAFSLLVPPPEGEERPPAATEAPTPVETTAPAPAAQPIAPEPAPHTSAFAPEPRDAGNALKTTLARHLLREDYAGAANLADASARATEPDRDAARLAAFVREVAALNKRVGEALSTQVGRTVTLRSGQGTVDIRPQAVAGDKLRATILDPEKPRTVTVNIAAMNPLDRSHWLAQGETTEAVSAMQCILHYRAGEHDRAREYARSAGPLADALSTLATQ